MMKKGATQLRKVLQNKLQEWMSQFFYKVKAKYERHLQENYEIEYEEEEEVDYVNRPEIILEDLFSRKIKKYKISFITYLKERRMVYIVRAERIYQSLNQFFLGHSYRRMAFLIHRMKLASDYYLFLMDLFQRNGWKILPDRLKELKHQAFRQIFCEAFLHLFSMFDRFKSLRVGFVKDSFQKIRDYVIFKRKMFSLFAETCFEVMTDRLKTNMQRAWKSLLSAEKKIKPKSIQFVNNIYVVPFVRGASQRGNIVATVPFQIRKTLLSQSLGWNQPGSQDRKTNQYSALATLQLEIQSAFNGAFFDQMPQEIQNHNTSKPAPKPKSQHVHCKHRDRSVSRQHQDVHHHHVHNHAHNKTPNNVVPNQPRVPVQTAPPMIFLPFETHHFTHTGMLRMPTKVQKIFRRSIDHEKPRSTQKLNLKSQLGRLRLGGELRVGRPNKSREPVHYRTREIY